MENILTGKMMKSPDLPKSAQRNNSVQLNDILSNDIVVIVTNYDFSDNADKLKAQFSKYFPTVMIDSQSPRKPQLVDIVVENAYYPGLWNKSVEYALSHDFKWLMFVASDLQILDVKYLCERASIVIKDENVGIYSACVSDGSRSSFPNLFRRSSSSSGFRECYFVEGFFFLARTEILKNIFPITQSNTSGWGVDVMSCYTSYQQNKIVVVDDCVEIFHPERLGKHGIRDNIAANEQFEYQGPDVNRWFTEKMNLMPSKLPPSGISKNSKCPCGSGVKYKRCHGKSGDL